MVLVPASMELLGDWNWYFPAWLDWLPRVTIEARPEPALRVSNPAVTAPDPR